MAEGDGNKESYQVRQLSLAFYLLLLDLLSKILSQEYSGVGKVDERCTSFKSRDNLGSRQHMKHCWQ